MARALHIEVPNSLRKDIGTFPPTDGFKRCRLLHCRTNDCPVFVFSASCLSPEAGYETTWLGPDACQ